MLSHVMQAHRKLTKAPGLGGTHTPVTGRLARTAPDPERLSAGTYSAAVIHPARPNKTFGTSPSSFRAMRKVRAKRAACCGILPLYWKIHGCPKRSACLHP